MPKGPCVVRAATVPSSSFQRLWLRVRWRVVALCGVLATLLLATASPTWAQTDVISEINVSGNRRIPADTIRARIFTKPGDIYDTAALERDFNSLWNTGYFEDIKIVREQTPKGWRLIISGQGKADHPRNQLRWPRVRFRTATCSIASSRTKSGWSVESQYDPTRIKKAEVSIKNLLSEHGRQFATIRTEVRQIPPAAVGITFVIKEGPKVKVGKIKFEGNKTIKSRDLRAAMKNLKPIGVPHSIFLENIFAKTYDATKLEEDTERVRAEYQNRGYFKAGGSDPKTEIHDTGHKGFHIPLLQSRPGKAVDITMPIEEGEQYRLGKITFKNNKAISNTRRAAFAVPAQGR